MQRFKLFFLISVLVSTGSWAFTQQAFVKQLVQDINAKEESRVKAACAPGFWENQVGDSAGHFYKQVSHPQRGILVQLNQPLKIVQDRAVALIDLYSAQEKQIVDQGFFYLEKKGDKWIWAGIDETKLHVDYFLAGKVPATFALRSYAALTDLDKWGKSFVEAFNQGQDWDARVEQVKGLMTYKNEISSTELYLFTDYPSLTYKNNYWVESLNRGAVVFEGINPEYPDYADEIVIYLEKEVQAWKFLGTSTYASSGSILE